MSGFINGSDGDLDRVFITSTEFFDNFVTEKPWLSGLNSSGELGDSTTVNKSSPVNLVLGSGSKWKSLSAGHACTLGIWSDGTLWSWGSNVNYCLGDGTTTNKSSPGTVAFGAVGQVWKQVSAGYYNSCAIKDNGTLWAWGINNATYQNLATGAVGGAGTSPMTVYGGGTNWKQVSAGNFHNAAIKTDGTLWTWGYNNIGQLGDGTTVTRSSPITTAGGGTDWKQVSTNGTFTYAIKIDGSIWSWGGNTYGQLGLGTTVARSSPGTTLFTGTWKQVTAGDSFVAAIKTDGTLWTCGYNGDGDLGDGTVINKSSPVTTVGGGTNWKTVSCGSYHTMAIKIDGTLWGWGYNLQGQIGDSTTGSKSSPALQTSARGLEWIQVDGGFEHSAGIAL